jgi:hypothetical protein
LGRLATIDFAERRIANPPQVANLPHMAFNYPGRGTDQTRS